MCNLFYQAPARRGGKYDHSFGACACMCFFLLQKQFPFQRKVALEPLTLTNPELLTHPKQPQLPSICEGQSSTPPIKSEAIIELAAGMVSKQAPPCSCHLPSVRELTAAGPSSAVPKERLVCYPLCCPALRGFSFPGLAFLAPLFLSSFRGPAYSFSLCLPRSIFLELMAERLLPRMRSGSAELINFWMHPSTFPCPSMVAPTFLPSSSRGGMDGCWLSASWD